MSWAGSYRPAPRRREAHWSGGSKTAALDQSEERLRRPRGKAIKSSHPDCVTAAGKVDSLVVPSPWRPRRDAYRRSQLRAHLQFFLDAYNHARRLKTLRGLTPYEHVLQTWTKEPERFRLDPSHHIPGPYT